MWVGLTTCGLPRCVRKTRWTDAGWRTSHARVDSASTDDTSTHTDTRTLSDTDRQIRLNVDWQTFDDQYKMTWCMMVTNSRSSSLLWVRYLTVIDWSSQPVRPVVSRARLLACVDWINWFSLLAVGFNHFNSYLVFVRLTWSWKDFMNADDIFTSQQIMSMNLHSTTLYIIFNADRHVIEVLEPSETYWNCWSMLCIYSWSRPCHSDI